MKKISIDDIDLQDIYAFMETGDVANAPAEVVEYLTTLDKVHKMHLRVLQWGNKEAILKHLMLVDQMSRYQAEKIHNEMLEYFYSDAKLSKQVFRNILFERMYNNCIAAEILALSTDDLSKVNRMYTEAGKMRQLDIIDPPVIPKEAFQRPNKIYAMDPAFLGEAKINRTLLAKHIDELEDYSEGEKLILKQDAAIEPIILFENEQENSGRPKQ